MSQAMFMSDLRRRMILQEQRHLLESRRPVNYGGVVYLKDPTEKDKREEDAKREATQVLLEQ